MASYPVAHVDGGVVLPLIKATLFIITGRADAEKLRLQYFAVRTGMAASQ